MHPWTYDFFFAELFLDLVVGLRFDWEAAAAFAGAFAGSFAGAFLLAAVFAALAASPIGAPFAFSAVAVAVAFFLAAAAAPLAAFPFAMGPLGAPLPFFLPHLPKVRTGAAASSVWHSSKVRLFGSLSLGILALRDLSVMYGP